MRVRQLQIYGCGRFLQFWDVQQRQGHLDVSSKVKYHAGDSEFCVGGCSCLWGP